MITYSQNSGTFMKCRKRVVPSDSKIEKVIALKFHFFTSNKQVNTDLLLGYK